MRCKVGDIAVMVGGCFPSNYGRWFVVVDRYRCVDDEWRVRCLGPAETTMGLAKAGTLLWANDFALRPIRDPGDEARDEMLRPLPVEDLDIAHA